MKGNPLSEKSFNLIKGLLEQGNSTKKVVQLLPEEIKVCPNTITKVSKSKDYNEYRGIKPEPKPPEKVIQITPYAQTEKVVEAINKTNILLESLFQIVKELTDSLK